jgi:hypothetical protein
MISTIKHSSKPSLFFSFFVLKSLGLEAFLGSGRVNACMVFGGGDSCHPPSRKDCVESCLMQKARAMQAR